MTRRVVAVVARKGGVGKTTVATALAVEGARRGRRVVVLDMDGAQGSALVWREVAAENGIEPVPVRPAMTALRSGFDRLVGDAELVVLDTPPRHDEAVRSALGVADVAVIPCGGGGPEVWAVLAAAELVAYAKKARPALRAHVVLTRVRPAAVEGLRDALRGLPVPVARTTLHARVAYERAVGAGMGPTTYEPSGQAAAEVRALYAELLGRAAR